MASFLKSVGRSLGLARRTRPFVAVLGLHSSGSSCTAGLLYHLGLHLGEELIGHYGKQPGKACGYEEKRLALFCEATIPLPALEPALPPWRINRKLKRRIARMQVEAEALGTVAAGKHPLLCQMGGGLRRACGTGLWVIDMERPVADSVKSLQKREQGRHAPEAIERHQHWLQSGKEQILAQLPPERVHTVHYYKLLEQTELEVARLAKFLRKCGVICTPQQRQAAVASIHPDKQHIAPLEERAA